VDDGLKPKLRWRVARVVDSVRETDSARTIGLAVPGWGGHLPGQHIDLKLAAEDGYSAQRSYSLSRPADGERIELTVQQIADASGAAVIPAGDVRAVLHTANQVVAADARSVVTITGESPNTLGDSEN
jgi:ferredoxin-NADP reductase